jgi:hypothetical protein
MFQGTKPLWIYLNLENTGLSESRATGKQRIELSMVPFIQNFKTKGFPVSSKHMDESSYTERCGQK